MTTTVAEREIPNLSGEQLEPSPWLEITRQRADRFAEATNDHRFIHVDPEKAAETPFGGPIAHGFPSLSLLSKLNAQSSAVPENLAMIVNYGSDRVRHLAPVRVGKRIRSHQQVLARIRHRLHDPSLVSAQGFFLSWQFK